MKFLVKCECDRNESFGDFGMHLDETTLQEIAPSARIAEYKVMRRHPSVRRCEIVRIHKEKHESRQTFNQALLAYLYYFVVAIAVYLLLGSSQYGTGMKILLAAFLPAGIFPLIVGAIYLLEGGERRNRERIAALERACFYRAGYRSGWAARERGASPEFIDWDQEEKSEAWPPYGVNEDTL